MNIIPLVDRHLAAIPSSPPSPAVQQLWFAAQERPWTTLAIVAPHLRDGVIRMTTEKTGERVAIAVSDDLTAALAAGPVGDLTFIAGVAGRPRDKAAFGEWFREACKAAGIAGKSAHGIRKAAATADAEAGWSPPPMSSHPSRDPPRR